MSSNPLLQHPHVYKKGKILNLKKLDEGTNKPKRVYNFASSSGNITTIQNHCNNLNQIVGRNFLGIAKLLSYFGLSKDPSEKFSKEPTVYNKFRNLFSDRGRDKDLQPLLEKTYDKLSNLDNKIEKQDIDLKKLINREPVSRKEIEDFSREIKEIKEKLVAILGA
ncbi:aphid transmission factor [Angelica bushy stunt virus]|uniref:Aphid transmission protein n=1 Tax=Angelica bushy stunt virus TaxID=1808970 RepID=A0A140GL59_9VIRU|nr:aphid transmission factor [Angelica bushy stunt virus]AMN10077.1 aphid transmission factor [Angelica bushy stunt virus]